MRYCIRDGKSRDGSADVVHTVWHRYVRCKCYSALRFGISVAVEGLYTTRILTEPSQGPFRMERQVLFSCQIEPLPPAPVTYQWRYLEDRFGGRSTGQNITRTYYEMSLHYCYYYCEVLMNGSLVGSASRIIELQGVLATYCNCYRLIVCFFQDMYTLTTQ